jgi:hypothetical protein
VPIVFTTILDPVGAGVVDSLARPGGNATGFIAFEYGLSGKWLELLKQRNAARSAPPLEFGEMSDDELRPDAGTRHGSA